jgi:hypothetical protein
LHDAKFRDCEERLGYRFPTHRMRLNFQMPQEKLACTGTIA